MRCLPTSRSPASSRPNFRDVEGDYVLVMWKSDQVRLGTDTFVVRDGKIVLQTVVVELA